GGEWACSNFKILNNVVQSSKSGVAGLIFQGGVTCAMVADNKFLAENASEARSTAIRNYSSGAKAGANQNNAYQSNQLAAGLKVVFEPPSAQAQSCFF